MVAEADAKPEAAPRVAVTSQPLAPPPGTRAAPPPTADYKVAAVSTTPQPRDRPAPRSEEHTSELQSLMRISYDVFCLKKQQVQPEHTDLTDTDDPEHKIPQQQTRRHPD